MSSDSQSTSSSLKVPPNSSKGGSVSPGSSPGKQEQNPKDSNSSDKEEKPPEKKGETKGWLYKWTNYIKGYQKRWFVLANGLLSYYRNQAEMAHTCRGTISLHGAHIHTEDSCNFIVSNGGGTQTFHLRASSEVERQRWVTALELAKAKAIQRMESSEDDGESIMDNDGDGGLDFDKAELTNVVKTLGAKLEDLQTCHELIVKHGLALQRSLGELEASHHDKGAGGDNRSDSRGSHHGRHVDEHSIKVKAVNERATLFKITSNAMINASAEFIELCQGHGRKWQKLLSNERDIRQRLEDMVEQLAKQHSHLENMVRKEIVHHGESGDNNVNNMNGSQHEADSRSARAKSPTSGGTASDEEDIFEDACDDDEFLFNVPVPPAHRRTSSEESQGGLENRLDNLDGEESDESDEEAHHHHKKETFNVVQRKSVMDDKASELLSNQVSSTNQVGKKQKQLVQRRTRIPDKPNISFSLGSIMKNCIGKDLSRIPVPVNFSEPLSMLQRIVEDFEYSEILDKAALCEDHCEQLAYVAAFTVSAFSSTAIRTSKPFNPLLGETFECDRSDDKGFKCISEQVMHHPPMLAQYCESTSGSWKSWQEFTMRSKFKGKYLEVEPLGIAHLVFPKTGNHYTWRKVKTVVHNIVIGKLWIDQHGEMEVINHRNGDKCYMKFEPYSYFGGVAKKVTGTITNSSDKVEWVLNGTWDQKLDGAKVIGESKSKGKSTSLEVGESINLWTTILPDPESEKYYNFSRFACELNDYEDGVAPTDSRLRPDQRLMEEGRWDEANTEKVRLEEKQRAVRRMREAEIEKAAQEGRTYEGHQPKWFKREEDEQNGGKLIHVYQGNYWESKEKQDWSGCPDIF